MKMIDKIKTWIKSIPNKVKGLFKQVKEFILRHTMSLIFIVGTTSYICIFPKFNPDSNPHLFFLLVVAFLIGSVRDHEVWFKQRTALEKEIESLKKVAIKKRK